MGTGTSPRHESKIPQHVLEAVRERFETGHNVLNKAESKAHELF